MKVYVVIEQWDFTDIGDSGISVDIYLTKEKAIEELNSRQKEIERSYEYYDVNTEFENGIIGFHNYEQDYSYNYTDIWIEEKEVIE